MQTPNERPQVDKTVTTSTNRKMVEGFNGFGGVLFVGIDLASDIPSTSINKNLLSAYHSGAIDKPTLDFYNQIALKIDHFRHEDGFVGLGEKFTETPTGPFGTNKKSTVTFIGSDHQKIDAELKNLKSAQKPGEEPRLFDESTRLALEQFKKLPPLHPQT